MRRVIPKIEFYITNVCNLTCQYFNRFNNLDFRGWQAWKDYQDYYAAWAELIDIKQIVVMGGEPLLNPSICEWISGLSTIWNTTVQVLSNGTRINHVKGLYHTVKNHPSFIGITIHNLDHKDFIVSEVEKFLTAPIQRFVGSENNKFNASLVLQDKNAVTVAIWITDTFLQNAVLPSGAGWTLHNNNPDAAHQICAFAQGKSYHFVQGGLYKCGPVALLPELDQQLRLDISEQDRELLNSYRPLTIDNYADYHKEFFDNLDNPIPQCKFCPSEGFGGKIFPIIKGSKST